MLVVPGPLKSAFVYGIQFDFLVYHILLTLSSHISNLTNFTLKTLIFY